MYDFIYQSYLYESVALYDMLSIDREYEQSDIVKKMLQDNRNKFSLLKVFICQHSKYELHSIFIKASFVSER